jgi:hypothetical protein
MPTTSPFRAINLRHNFSKVHCLRPVAFAGIARARTPQRHRRNGFVVNPDKAHYADRNSRRIVTGVKINAGLNVDRRYVRHIRALLHSVENLGLVGAQQKYTDGGGKGAIAEHLRGKISYIKHLKGQTDPVVRSSRCASTEALQSTRSGLPRQLKQRDRAVWVVEYAIDGPNGPECKQGTAFFLKDIGFVTASHCVEGAAELRSTTRPSRRTSSQFRSRSCAIIATLPC